MLVIGVIMLKVAEIEENQGFQKQNNVLNVLQNSTMKVGY